MKLLSYILFGSSLALAKQTYNQTFSQTAVYYSEAAFCEGEDLEDWKCGDACKKEPGVTKLFRLKDASNEGVFGFVAYNEVQDLIIVSFRGSQNTANWISNFDYFQEPYKGSETMMVHTGFFSDYELVSPQVISAVSTLIQEHPTARMLFTGHSLGAALTTFAAVDVMEQLAPKNEMLFYSFGSPRTGNQAFSDHIMTLYPDYFRVVHYTDIVPHLPMTEFGFNHAGTEVWYTEPMFSLEHVFCPNVIGQPENENCADTLWSYDPAAHMQYVGINLNYNWCDGTPKGFLQQQNQRSIQRIIYVSRDNIFPDSLLQDMSFMQRIPSTTATNRFDRLISQSVYFKVLENSGTPTGSMFGPTISANSFGPKSISRILGAVSDLTYPY